MKHIIDTKTILILKKSFDKWFMEERFYPADFDVDAFEKGAKSAFDHIYNTISRHNNLAKDIFLRPTPQIRRRASH
jgi:hypothetical protein